MSKKECLPRKNGSVSRGMRKQKKSPEPSTPREQRVPELYPTLPGPGEDMLDPLNALPPYPRREVPHSTQPEEGGTLASPPHTRGGTREGEEVQYPQHLRHFCHSVRHRPDWMPLPEHPLG